MQFKPITAIAVLLLVVASLLVSGCTSTTSDIRISKTFGMKATQETAPQEIGFKTPNKGYKFVMYNVTVTNEGSDPLPMHIASFTANDSNNNTYEVNNATYTKGFAHFPYSGDAYIVISPRDKATGLLVFEIPQSAELVNLVYKDDALGFNGTVNL